MQSHRSPRSAAPVGKAAGQAGLDQLIKETGEVAQVLADPNSKASVEHWLDTLRPLVTGRDAFELPEDIGAVFVKDAVPLFLLVAEPLLALLAATLRAIIDRRGRPLLKRAASDPDAQKQADEWAACAGRVLGGATNWQVKNELSETELLMLAKALLPTLCDLLFDDTLAPFRRFQRDIIDLLSVLTEESSIIEYATHQVDGHPALLSREKFADLLYRFRVGPSAAFLDVLDIAVHLLPGGPRESAERVAFAKSCFGRFRPDIAARAGAEMVRGKSSQWMTVTRFKILRILAEEGLDVMQPVPVVEFADTGQDGVDRRHLQSESDQNAIRQGLLCVFIDCDEIAVEGNIDADGNAMVLGFEDILEIMVDEKSGTDGSTTVLRIRITNSEARIVLAIPYHKLYDILSQRPIACAIPPPTANPSASLRSSKAAEDLRLPDPGQQALAQAGAREKAKPDKAVPRRSAATEARAAIVSQTVQSGSTSSRKTSSTTSGSKSAAAQAVSSSPRKDASKTKGKSVARKAAPRPPPRPPASSLAIRHVSDLGSDLSEPAEPPSSAGSKTPPISPKRKRREDASADELVDETIVLDNDSPRNSPPKKRARVPDKLSDGESMPDKPETLVPPKARVKPRASYGKKAARASGKPTSTASAQSIKVTSTSLKASKAASVADDTWDDLPGVREVAKPAANARPKPKPRTKKTSPAPAAAKKVKKSAPPAKGKAEPSKAASDQTQASSERPTRALPARRAAAHAREEISRGMSEEIEDDSQRMDDVDAEDAESPIEDFTPQDQRLSKRSAGSGEKESGLYLPDETARQPVGNEGRAESPPAKRSAAQVPGQDEGAERAARATSESLGSPRAFRGPSGTATTAEMEEPVDEANRMEEVPSERDVGSPGPSEPVSYDGGGMDYEPEMAASESIPQASQLMSQSLGEPVAVSPSAESTASVSARLKVSVARSRSASPAVQVFQDSPRLPSASSVFSRPGALRQSSIQASKAAEAQEARARALEEQMQQRLEAERVDHMDVFDEAPSMPDTRLLSTAVLGDAHSTPRAQRRLLTASAADKSFSEPPAVHARSALDDQSALDTVTSHRPTLQMPRSSPIQPQPRPDGGPAATDRVKPGLPTTSAAALRNVRVLSQPEYILAEPHFESTAGSAATASGAAGEAAQLRPEPASQITGHDQPARAAAGTVGRTATGQAGPSQRGKTVLSPRSAGLTAQVKRHPSQSQSQRAATGRLNDPPQAKALKKMLDGLNDELVDKVARRIHGTRNGARDASLEYQLKLTALHRRFADENQAILVRNDQADAQLTKELEMIAGDLADCRVANQKCADEVALLRERYKASYTAQQTALADAMAGLRLMRRPA